MNRRNFIKNVGILSAVAAVPTITLGKTPASLEQLGFVKQEHSELEFCNIIRYSRADGILLTLQDSSDKIRVFWTPDFSVFNTWSYEAKDWSDMVTQVYQHVGYRYKPRTDWERINQHMCIHGYLISSEGYQYREYIKGRYEIKISQIPAGPGANWTLERKVKQDQQICIRAKDYRRLFKYVV